VKNRITIKKQQFTWIEMTKKGIRWFFLLVVATFPINTHAHTKERNDDERSEDGQQ